MTGWTPPIDFRHYIGYMVGGFCVAVYAAIFLYIYKDGEFERNMRRRANKAGQRNGGFEDLGDQDQDDTKKDR